MKYIKLAGIIVSSLFVFNNAIAESKTDTCGHDQKVYNEKILSDSQVLSSSNKLKNEKKSLKQMKREYQALVQLKKVRQNNIDKNGCTTKNPEKAGCRELVRLYGRLKVHIADTKSFIEDTKQDVKSYANDLKVVRSSAHNKLCVNVVSNAEPTQSSKPGILDSTQPRVTVTLKPRVTPAFGLTIRGDDPYKKSEKETILNEFPSAAAR